MANWSSNLSEKKIQDFARNPDRDEVTQFSKSQKALKKIKEETTEHFYA